MTNQQENHLQQLKDDFCKKFDAKYRKGALEHGGDLWLKTGMIDMLEEEVLDLWAYVQSLRWQIENSNLGEKKDER